MSYFIKSMIYSHSPVAKKTQLSDTIVSLVKQTIKPPNRS